MAALSTLGEDLLRLDGVLLAAARQAGDVERAGVLEMHDKPETEQHLRDVKNALYKALEASEAARRAERAEAAAAPGGGG